MDFRRENFNFILSNQVSVDGEPWALDVSENLQLIACGSSNGNIYLINMDDFGKVTILCDAGGVLKVSFNQNGSHLVVCTLGAKCLIVETKCSRIITGLSFNDWVSTCTWLDVNRFAIGGFFQGVYIINIDGRILQRLDLLYSFPDLVSTSSHIYAISHDHTVSKISLSTGLIEESNDFEEKLLSISLGRPNNLIVVLRSGTIVFMDPCDLSSIRSYNFLSEKQMNFRCFRSKFGGEFDEFIVVGDEEGHLRIFHCKLESIVAEIVASQKLINDLYITSSMKIISASDDGIISFFKLSTN